MQPGGERQLRLRLERAPEILLAPDLVEQATAWGEVDLWPTLALVRPPAHGYPGVGARTLVCSCRCHEVRWSPCHVCLAKECRCAMVKRRVVMGLVGGFLFLAGLVLGVLLAR